MNSAERWEKIKDIFESALARSGAERRAFLEGACGSDTSMLSEVESLLSSFDANYLDGSAVEEVAEAVVGIRSGSLRPDDVIAQYKIVDQIGKGGQGSVYKAIDTKLNRMVAIKLLPPELTIDETARKRFHREAQIASSLDHPNVCPIYDYSEADGRHFIVMQFVEGQSLRDLLAAGPIDPAVATRIGLEICDAVAAAHERGIIHRDLKPANIIVSAKGPVKVLDFGLAKLTITGSQDETAQMVSTTGAVMGTVPYMSPEQVRGKILDARTDIFSFGAVLFEMLSGRQPFERENIADTIAAIINEEPPIADIPDDHRAIVAKALAKDPAKRYESIGDLRDDLALLAGPVDAVSGDGRSWASGRIADQPRRISRMALAIGAAIFLLLVVSGGYFLLSGRAARDRSITTARKLTRLTFDTGLQSKPSWSPDGRVIAYYSDKSGNLDLWVQQVAGGDPLQVTRSPAHDWQPDISPDGNTIVFRSEREGGGLFTMPTFGGTERKLSPTGYDPRWSPDGSGILFYNTDLNGAVSPPKVYTIAADGKDLREVWPEASNAFVSHMRVDWHPDGKRVSFVGQLRKGDLGFWTVPIDSGAPVRSELSEEVARQVKEAGITFYDFAWAKGRDALFLEGESNGVRNLWRVAVDAETLAWTLPFERLTTGAGKDAEMAVSPDGHTLAFTTQTDRTRIWGLPFDAASGKLRGDGQPIPSAGMDTGEFSLAASGKGLVFVAKRAGKLELWQKDLVDGKENVLVTANDDDVITSPRISIDGGRIAFARNHNPDPARRRFTQTFEKSILLLSIADGRQEALTSSNELQGWPWDWSSDGNYILGSSAVATAEPEHWGLYLFPVEAAPQAEAKQELVFDDPRYNIWQGKFSPDGKWVLFLAAGVKDESDSFVGVVPASGGEAVRLVSNDVDKPRWAHDGKSIYFYSNRSGFRNVWSIRFDPLTGKAPGEPFRITDFQSPDQMLIGSPQIGHAAMINDLGATVDRLVVNVTQVSGSIWLLDNVDR